MNGPRAFTLSDRSVANSTMKKAAMLGGAVKSCAVVVLVYPRPVMIVGKKSVKLYQQVSKDQPTRSPRDGVPKDLVYERIPF